MRIKFSPQFIFIVAISLIFFGVLVMYSTRMQGYQQFSYLASSFLQGKLYFLQSYGSWWHDAVQFKGQYYWPLGPLPAVVLMPFVWIWQQRNMFFNQGYLQMFLVFAVFVLIIKLAKQIGYRITDAFFLAVAFCFASAFLGVAFWPNSWFFAQVIATLLLLLSFVEYRSHKRYFVIGMLYGLVLLTRFPASLGITFFVIMILFGREKWKTKIKHLIQLGVPFVAGGLLLGWYNYARFGDFFEQGYAMQITAGAFSDTMKQKLFALHHIPGNLYYLLLAAPQPVVGSTGHIFIPPFFKADPWGMGIFFTSPYLLTLFGLQYRDLISRALLVASLIIALPIITYYGIGWYQFGYRYSLDFLPFLFFTFMYLQSHKQLNILLKIVIVLSAVFNLYLFQGLFILG